MVEQRRLGGPCVYCAGKFGAHQPGCTRLVDRCVHGKHDICEFETCGCVCHPEFTATERFRLRQLIGG